MGPLGEVGRDHFTNIDEKFTAFAVRRLTGVGAVKCTGNHIILLPCQQFARLLHGSSRFPKPLKHGIVYNFA